jgi:superfamily II DNA or RNA helicase
MHALLNLISSFDQDNHARGIQFEKLCKWILENHPLYKPKLKKVWLWDDWPERWGRDCGIDLVAEDVDGKTWAIQAKCYDPKNSVTKKDIDSFLSESANSKIHHRLLIATTDGIGANARAVIGRQNDTISFSQMMLSNLLEAPLEWPKSIHELSTATVKKRFKPKPYQQKAIVNVVQNLDRRGQLIMACGTGKTLTGLWIDERLNSNLTLVLLPSLLLLSKTLTEWLTHCKEPFSYLPVCSDDTVAKSEDAINLSTAELSFPTTTDADDIAKFVQGKGRKVIFSTYQSSEKIAEAFQLYNLKAIDLVIADEAHRCAGKADSAYSTVLDNQQLPAAKRLFMTATPRIFQSAFKKKASDSGVEVMSMDDEAVFGSVLHKLSFGEAIEQDLLTDYQVVVVGINNSSYSAMIDERKLVKTDTDIHSDAQSLASHIGLAKAIKNYDLRRVISFHSRVSSAHDFANQLPEVIEWMPSEAKPDGELLTNHVSGAMPTNERNRNLQALGNITDDQRYILSNARCLSEGVDVPALDGVAFIDPRNSEIDIVQAVGRAIRLSKGKALGSIVIPVFIEDHEDPDEVLNSSPFKKVWAVVNALRSHDEGLGEQLDQLRQSMGKRGTVGTSDKIIFDLPTTITHKFESALNTKVIESTTASWEFFYGLLSDYIEAKKHARVQAKEIFKDKHLGVWCDTQRLLYRQNKLPSLRIDALEKFFDKGWVWSLKDSQREENIKLLTDFYKRNGHCLPTDVSRSETTKNSKFNRDANNIAKGLRQAYTSRTLEGKWVDFLEKELFFKWDPEMFWWLEQYKGLRRWARKHKSPSPLKGTTCKIKIGESTFEDRNISLFRSTCVKSYNYWILGEQGKREIPPRKLSDRQFKAIGNIPFWVWDANKHRWEEAFTALLDYIAENGDPHVPASRHKVVLASGRTLDLSRWCVKQRYAYDDGKLSAEKISRLNSVNFDWTGELAPKKKKFKLDQSDFDGRIVLLQQWIDLHGHAYVPQDESFKGESLGNIVSWWRQAYFGKGRRPLTTQQINTLESLHPTWLWSAADIREGISFPKPDHDAKSLLNSRKDHEINRVIQYGLYAGLRVFESVNFQIKQHHGVLCFYLPKRTGYCEHYVPIHSSLVEIQQATKSTQSLGTFYRRLAVMRDASKEERQFFSLHLTFREKLKEIGLDSQLINGLSGYNPRMEWSAEEMKTLKDAIDQISYD